MKENNGAAARRTMIQKVTLLTILAAFAVLAHQYSNKLLNNSFDDSKRLRPVSSVVSEKNGQSDTVNAATWSKEMSEIQAEDKESIERLNDNKEFAPHQVSALEPKIMEKKEGRLIEFTIGNIQGQEGKVGTFVVQTYPSWAPLGVQRFEELTAISFWDDCRFFRVVPKFIVQFGINGDPATQKKWENKRIKDDPVMHSNEIGTITFATAGPNTRTTQMFINTGEKNSFLDKQGFSVIGKVISGMATVQNIYKGYGEQPKQNLIQNKGNAYLNASYPKLSYIQKAKFLD